MRASVVLLVVVLSGVVGTAPAKVMKDSSVPKLFCQARFAYVKTADADLFDTRVLPSDRDVASALEQHLRDWNRYTLVERPGEADLVWVVRTGRTVDAGVGSAGNSRVPARPGAGSAAGPLGPAPGGTPDLGTNSEDPADAEGGPGTPGVGGAPLADRNDLLAVYQGAAEGTPQHTWLWRKSEAGGLVDSGMPLFEQIRNAVDAQCMQLTPAKH